MLIALLRAHRQISRNRGVLRKQTEIGQPLHTSSPAHFIEGNGPFEPTDQHLSTNADATDLIKFPEAPDPSTCCASGCPNCVWVQYADDVMKYFSINRSAHNSLSAEQQLKLIRKQIDRHIQDVNLRAYLWMELKAKKFN